MEKKDIASLKTIINRQKQTDQWKRGFISNPATWLNQGRWTDDTASMSGGNNGNGNGQTAKQPNTFGRDFKPRYGAGQRQPADIPDSVYDEVRKAEQARAEAKAANPGAAKLAGNSGG
jgi:hypothetical protein